MGQTITIPATTLRMPGRAGTDPRYAVTMREEGTPWPLVFYFLLVEDDESGITEWINVGFEVGERWESEPGSGRTMLETNPEPVDAVALQRIAANYALYVRFAREALVLNREGMAGAVEMLRARGRTRRGLTDDFYRLIASEYQSRRMAGGHPIKEMAEAHHADKSTVSRWVKEAKRRDLISADQAREREPHSDG